jgi:hypothetical protein
MSRSAAEVVVRLNSGLGNQLFQLAQGMALAEEGNARLRFDTTWFSLISGLHPVRRELRLSQFNVSLPEAFRGARRLAIGIIAALFDKTRRGKALLSGLGWMKVVEEGAIHAEHQGELGMPGGGRIYLNGYWQTNTAFISIRDKILPMLCPKNPLSPSAETLITKAKSNNAGFIHVRRGDYLHFMGDKGVLPTGYYSRALAKLHDTGKRVSQWMILTEDIEWARANLGFVPNAEIVDYQSSNHDIEDLMIMKACSAGIIANSSYSWWGAALGDHPDRPIITPDRYWKDFRWTADGWALPNWLQVRAWD